MGRDVLDRLVLRGDETVLDAGCGTGKVTRLLHERLPARAGDRGRRRAVDGRAGARAAAGRRSTCAQADLTTLDLGEPVDAILSTATFHWIADHDRLFARLHRRAAARRPARRPVRRPRQRRRRQGGRLAVAAEPPFAAHLGGWEGDWNYAAPEETERRLRAAGFTDVWCWLSRVDVDPGDPHAYLRLDLPRLVPRAPAGRAARGLRARGAGAAPRPARACTTCGSTSSRGGRADPPPRTGRSVPARSLPPSRLESSPGRASRAVVRRAR